jgi:hypothetical protein
VPGGVIVPFFASAGILWLLSNLTKPELIGIAIFIVFFSLIYLVVKLAKGKAFIFLIVIAIGGSLQAQQRPDKIQLEVQQAIKNTFKALSNGDTVGLKNYCTSDVTFFEYGAIWNIDTIMNMAGAKQPPDFKRIDRFNFINTTIRDNTAWVSYYLESDITRNGTHRTVRWQETVILVKYKNRWKIKVLHSTNITRK